MNVIQVNTGSFVKVIPGARMFRIVTMKFKPAAIDAMPSTLRPSTQYVIPSVGLYAK